MEKITKSAQQTKEFAANFAKKLKGGEILCLYGDLGSGKTTFVQGLAEGLGIKKRILSPTFVLMRSYETKVKSEKLKVKSYLHHIDLYRIESAEEIEMLGLQEIFNNPQDIVAIEWAERIKQILPSKRTDIYFEHIDENIRRIKINAKYQMQNIKRRPI